MSDGPGAGRCRMAASDLEYPCWEVIEGGARVPVGAPWTCATRAKKRDESGGDRDEFHEFRGFCTLYARCTACHNGELRPARLTITPTYDGKSLPVDDDEALVCGDELIGERAAAFLLTQRALAPHAEMTATVARRTNIV